MIRLPEDPVHECRSMNRYALNHPKPSIQESRWTEVLGDHNPIEIRSLDRADAATSGEPHGTAAFPSGDIVSVSVFGQVAGLPAECPDDATAPIECRTFVAVARDISGERTIGIGELRSFDRGLRCRCDVVAEREWLGRGLGTVLMRHLVWISSLLGMQDLRASCAPEEHAVTDLLHSLEFRAWRDEANPAQILHQLHLTRQC